MFCLRLAYEYKFVSAQIVKFRSSRSQMFLKIGVLKKFFKFKRKALVVESLINKVAGI